MSRLSHSTFLNLAGASYRVHLTSGSSISSTSCWSLCPLNDHRHLLQVLTQTHITLRSHWFVTLVAAIWLVGWIDCVDLIGCWCGHGGCCWWRVIEVGTDGFGDRFLFLLLVMLRDFDEKFVLTFCEWAKFTGTCDDRYLYIGGKNFFSPIIGV